MPVIRDPNGSDEYINFFIAQADEKASFRRAMSDSDVPITTATVHQRKVGGDPVVELADDPSGGSE